MDKFDEQLKASKQTYEPKPGFVDATMQRIEGMRHRRRWNIKVWAPAVAGLAIIAVFVALPFGSHTFTSKNNANTPTATQTRTAPSSTVTQNSAATNGSASAGTDNASLTNDLNSVQSSMSQENSDQNSSNAALNDSQQEVNVPTS